MADVWDRNLGQLGITCPYLHDQLGRAAYTAADSKKQWVEWNETEHGEKPDYWLVAESEEDLLRKWKCEHEKRSKERCSGR